jgi:hypothetical protein
MNAQVLRAKTIDELIDLTVTTVNEMLLLHSDKELFRQKAKQLQQIQNMILEKRIPVSSDLSSQAHTQ